MLLKSIFNILSPNKYKYVFNNFQKNMRHIKYLIDINLNPISSTYTLPCLLWRHLMSLSWTMQIFIPRTFWMNFAFKINTFSYLYRLIYQVWILLSQLGQFYFTKTIATMQKKQRQIRCFFGDKGLLSQPPLFYAIRLLITFATSPNISSTLNPI